MPDRFVTPVLRRWICRMRGHRWHEMCLGSVNYVNDRRCERCGITQGKRAGEWFTRDAR